MNKRNQNGIALLTALLVAVVVSALIGAALFLTNRGYNTYSSYRTYQTTLQKVQGGIEEALLDIENKTYSELKQVSNNTTISGASYEIYQVFWKPLSGFGGSVNFPPTSSAYTGVFGVGVFYLIHSTATQGNTKADVYTLYIKGY